MHYWTHCYGNREVISNTRSHTNVLDSMNHRVQRFVM